MHAKLPANGRTIGQETVNKVFVRGLTGLAVAWGLGSCASISGLNAFSNTCDFCSDDASATTPDDTTVAPMASEATDQEDAGGASDAETPEGAPEQSLYPDGTDGVEGSEGDAARDARTESGSPPDAAAEAASCNAASCKGCCTTAGLCAAGGSNSACGVGGDLCQVCSPDLACNASGSCAAPPVDAGMSQPPGCEPSTCTNLCVPYFIQCCKSDETCGCALLFPMGSCN
jgi:hypothetical protein